MGVREVLERRRALGVVAGEGAPCNRDVGGVARHYYTTGIRVPQELPIPVSMELLKSAGFVRGVLAGRYSKVTRLILNAP